MSLMDARAKLPDSLAASVHACSAAEAELTVTGLNYGRETARACRRALCALALAGDEVLEGLKATLSESGGDDGAEAALAGLARLVSAASGPAQNRGLAVLRAALR